MGTKTLSGQVRGGGHWVLRWTVRLLVLLGLGVCLALPYEREVVGECRLVPLSQRGVRAPLAGEILAVEVREGDAVEAGSLIATLDDREVAAELATANAELDRLQAELDLLEAGPRPEEVAVAREQLALWQVRLDHYERELSRVRGLAEADAATEEELSSAQVSRDATVHLVASAQENLAKLEEGAREEEVRAKRAEIARVQARADYNRQLIDLTRIHSPIQGKVVTPFMVERIGQVVEAGELIALVQDNSSLEVEIAADEAAAALVSTGNPVKVRLFSLDGELLTAEVRSVALATSDESEIEVHPIRSDRERQLERSKSPTDEHLVRVYCTLPRDHRLAPGMTGYARIVVDSSQLWRELLRPIERFLFTDVWSWMP
ncbi:MAG: HlyD family efflux transporter periplasmic adaptor subunit [Planctomycetota bacterium]|jgi:multidrug resistance efflux pump|nr:HlyD family efflux transporter periplasmic adaptor subunit [Planctomycetota bacterium]